MGIPGVIKIVAPLQWRVFSGEDGKLVTIENTVAAWPHTVSAFDELRMPLFELLKSLGKGFLSHGKNSRRRNCSEPTNRF